MKKEAHNFLIETRNEMQLDDLSAMVKFERRPGILVYAWFLSFSLLQLNVEACRRSGSSTLLYSQEISKDFVALIRSISTISSKLEILHLTLG